MQYSLGVIKEISQANIRTVMVTGDNILTSVNVARECGIIDADVQLLIAETTAHPEPTLKWKTLDTKDPHKETSRSFFLNERYILY